MTEDRSVLTRSAPAPAHTVSYGSDPDQVIDCYPVATNPRPTVVFIHGGYWRPEYDRDHARSAAVALADAGYPTALIEYRRIPGDPDAMVQDVAAAIAAVATGATPLPPGPVLLVGHSAGGQLAVLAAHDPHVQACLALAPVADLAMADELDLDDGAVRAFLGRPAEELPDLDPARRGSPACPVIVLHGQDDTLAPLALSESYTSATSARLVPLAETGHFALIDPRSASWPEVIGHLHSISAATGIE